MPADRPNILVVLTDQQRWDTVGLHGNPLDLTPTFDRFAVRGTHLARSFTCQPVCGPARASLQTGLFPTATGCYRNGIPLPQDADTIARRLGRAGYRTGYIGKWHLASGDPVPEEERGGYRDWLASNILEFTSEPYATTLYDQARQPVSLPGYRVDALTDAAVRYLADRAGEPDPFFLFLSYLEPHHHNRLDDYVAPEGYRERYAGRWVPPDLAALGGSTHQHLGGYHGTVKRIDEAFARLLDALTSLRLRDHTVVLFTSDHGCHFKTRNVEYKRSCHEASIRVPTALAGPGFDGGGWHEELVSSVDLVATLLDVAGVPDRALHGRSVIPLTRGGADGWPEDVFVQVSESQVGRALRTGRWKYAVVAPDHDGDLHPGAERYVETHLYDLACDPYELDDLVGLRSHAEVADRLRALLVARMVAAGEDPPEIVPAPPRESGQRRVLPAELLA